MSFHPFRFALTVVLVLILQGCSTVKYDRILVSNRSNIGFDLDSPPTKIAFAISSTRKIITPTFEGGQTPPVLSGMSSRAGMVGRFFDGISSTIATGDAAHAMSYLYADCNPEVRSVPEYPGIKLTRKPKTRPVIGDVRPAIYVSSSMWGAMVSWSHDVPLIVSSVKMGFSRKEEISTAVSITYHEKGYYYSVEVPSFLVTIDNSADLKAKAKIRGESGSRRLKHLQFFAIGQSANDLTLRSDVRQVLFKRITPEMQDTFCGQDQENKVW